MIDIDPMPNKFAPIQTDELQLTVNLNAAMIGDRAMTGKHLAKPYLLAHSLVASLFHGAMDVKGQLREFGFEFPKGSLPVWQENGNKRGNAWMTKTIHPLEKRPIIRDVQSLPVIETGELVLLKKASHNLYLSMATINGVRQGLLS